MYRGSKEMYVEELVMLMHELIRFRTMNTAEAWLRVNMTQPKPGSGCFNI
jgi:hypothetical protein